MNCANNLNQPCPLSPCPATWLDYGMSARQLDISKTAYGSKSVSIVFDAPLRTCNARHPDVSDLSLLQNALRTRTEVRSRLEGPKAFFHTPALSSCVAAAAASDERSRRLELIGRVGACAR
jgi:hypothetical protein